MFFLGGWIFFCLTAGVILFFIIGIFFLKKEVEWNRFDKARELWDLSLDIIKYIKENNPGINSLELKEEMKKVASSLKLALEEEFWQVLVEIGSKKQ